MLIMYLEGIGEVFSHGYRLCNADPKNIRVRASPDEECERMKGRRKEDGKIQIVHSRCAVWNKENLFFIDSSLMVKAAGDPDHLCPLAPDLWRVAEAFNTVKEGVPPKLFVHLDLAIRIDKILATISDKMSFGEEIIKHDEVLKQLIDLESRSWDSVDDLDIEYKRRGRIRRTPI